jgi:hypothetical protein
MPIFACKNCDYETRYKTNFVRHLNKTTPCKNERVVLDLTEINKGKVRRVNAPKKEPLQKKDESVSDECVSEERDDESESVSECEPVEPVKPVKQIKPVSLPVSVPVSVPVKDNPYLSFFQNKQDTNQARKIRFL